MLKIRLKRIGRKHDPSYRIIVTESTRGPKAGDYIETLGNYDPRTNAPTVNVERARYWLSVGAQTSPTVHNIFVGQKLVEGKKINVLPKKTPIVKEGVSESSTQATDEQSPTAESSEESPEEGEPLSEGETTEGGEETEKALSA